MSDELLRNIWDGDRGLDLSKQQSETETDILREMEHCDALLEHMLSESGQELLEKYRTLGLNLCAECEYQAFKVGYSFGVKMIMDALQR